MFLKSRGKHRESGMALGIVVWFIAGMSLLVSGIVFQAKVDTKLAQIHYFKAMATAAGDGAINLALAEQISLRESGQGGIDRQRQYRVGQQVVDVVMIPGDIFVNLNTATTAELIGVFSVAANEANGNGESSRFDPRSLADAVVNFRDGKGSGNSRRQSFYSPEDLLRVPGLSRSVYDGVRDFIVVTDIGASGGPNWTVEEKLSALNAIGEGTGMALQGVVRQNTSFLRIDAKVSIGDKSWLRRRWVSMGSGDSGLPWQFVRSEAVRALGEVRNS